MLQFNKERNVWDDTNLCSVSFTKIAIEILLKSVFWGLIVPGSAFGIVSFWIKIFVDLCNMRFV